MHTRLLALAVTASLAAAPGSAQIDLLPGGFFAPSDTGAWDLEDGHTILRYSRDHVLYVTEPGDVTVTIGCRRVGQNQQPASFAVRSADGTDLATASAPVGESASATFSAAAAGPYALRVDGGRNGFTLAAEGAKLLLPAGYGGQSFHGVTSAAPIYLFVPPGADQFDVKLIGQGTGETAQARLLGPGGEEVRSLSTVGKMSDSATVEVPAGADDAVWALVIEPAEEGMFEDFEVLLSGDVSPYVSERPEDVLCPAMQALSERVSRERRDPILPIEVTLYADLAQFGGATLELAAHSEDGAEAWSESFSQTDSRSISVAPEERLADGKYQWSARLLHDGEEIRRFDGRWWYIPAPNYLTEDGMTLVNGEPFFARGLYHVEPEDYELVKAHGFNVVQCHADNVEAAEAAGLNTGVALYWGSSPGSEAWRAKVDLLLDNESIFAWWIQDEPDGSRMSTDLLADCYMYIRERDPNRPAYTCLCVPGSYPDYAPQTDIVSIDVYPIGRGRIESIAETLEHAQNVIPNHVNYFIGQIWPWPNARQVEAPEHRAMTYLALTHGARGLFWYSFRDPNWYIPDDNPAVWAEMKRVNDELTVLEPALLNANLGEATFAHGAIHASARRAGDELFVMAVNPTEEPVSAQLLLSEVAPGVACSAAAEEMFEDRQLRVVGGAIIDEFEPLAVHVYRLAIQ